MNIILSFYSHGLSALCSERVVPVSKKFQAIITDNYLYVTTLSPLSLNSYIWALA